MIYTVDPSDAKTYKLIYWPTPYAKIYEFTEIKPNKDVYFCGVTKNRNEQLKKVLSEAKKRNINIKMDIICNCNEKEDFDCFKNDVNLHIGNNYLKYQEVLNNSLQASCILEIVQEGQAALTLRPYEAVAYNRKLLTNNKSILNYKYYDPKYMFYFEKVEHIDWDWVKDNSKVNYNYKDDFSSNKLINDIIKRIELEKEKV